MAKREIPMCKKCGQLHWYVVTCTKAAEMRERALAAQSAPPVEAPAPAPVDPELVERRERREAERVEAEAERAARIEREFAEIDARQAVLRNPVRIYRHDRPMHGDKVTSVIRMGERNLALPRERGAHIGSKREVA